MKFSHLTDVLVLVQEPTVTECETHLDNSSAHASAPTRTPTVKQEPPSVGGSPTIKQETALVGGTSTIKQEPALAGGSPAVKQEAHVSATQESMPSMVSEQDTAKSPKGSGVLDDIDTDDLTEAELAAAMRAVLKARKQGGKK